MASRPAFGLISEGSALLNDSAACERRTRSCGRFGPARLGSTVARSSAEQFGVFGFGRFVVVEESLLAAVGLDQRDLFFAAAGEAQIAQGFFVDGEDAAGGAVFGRHVGDGGAIGERKIAQAGAEVLDELSDDAVLAQHLGDGENEVGGGGAFAQASGELHADDQRNQHGDRLAEHGGFGFDAADAPAENAEAVDHRGVASRCRPACRDRRCACRLRSLDEDYAGEVFEIDLVDDAGVGRDDGEVAEAGLSPAEEGVALFVALEFEQRVHVEGAGGAEFVDLHGVVDDEFDGLQRIDERGIAAELLHGVAHGGEIDDAGTPVKSCRRTRLGVKAISLSGLEFLFQAASARISSLVTLRPSSVRSRFSSRMRRENGRCLVEMPCLSRASRR